MEKIKLALYALKYGFCEVLPLPFNSSCKLALDSITDVVKLTDYRATQNRYCINEMEYFVPRNECKIAQNILDTWEKSGNALMEGS